MRQRLFTSVKEIFRHAGATMVYSGITVGGMSLVERGLTFFQQPNEPAKKEKVLDLVDAVLPPSPINQG